MEGYFTHNFDYVGYHDLEKRPAFKLGMQVVDGRWYLYLAHFWHSGWTILDVTDPARPELAAWVPGPDNTGTYQMQVADRKMVTALEFLPPEISNLDPNKPYEEGIYVWDVAEPTRPRLLGQWKSGGTGTHRNHFDGGRYAHLAAGVPGYSGNIYVIVDLADPARPEEGGRWFVPEQFAAGGGIAARRYSLHGPAYVEDDRAYLGYGGAGMIILDISDVTRPRLISRLDFGDAFTNSLGVHTVIPLPRRKLAVVNTEAIAEESQEPLNFAGLVDLADETNPRLISLFPSPVPPPGAGYPNFQQRGGRFGPHNQHHWQHQDCLFESDELVYLTWFNGGLRAYDIRDPYLPREVGYFVQPDPRERLGHWPKSKLVAQAEDVLVDARGYAYFTEKNQGVFIVRYSGS